MKRTLQFILITLLSITLISVISLSGCKDKTAPAEEVEEVAEEIEAEVTETEETEGVSETEEVVITDVKQIAPDNIPADWKIPATIGHITNFLIHEWYQNITLGEKARCDDFGIEFSTNDANLDLQKSLAALDDYVSKGIDVIVFTPVNEEASGPAVCNAVEKGAVVICESSPVDCMTTLVAADDYANGKKVGIWAGEDIKDNFDGVDIVVLDIGLPALSTTVARSEGFRDGLTSIVPDAKFVSVDGKGVKDEAVKVAADALTANPDVNVIFGINDDSTLGGIQAYQAGGFDEDKFIGAFSTDFGGKLGKNSLLEGGHYKAVTAMFPEMNGWLLINTAIAVYNGMDLPEHIVSPSAVVTIDNFSDYYTQDGDEYLINFEAVNQISD